MALTTRQLISYTVNCQLQQARLSHCSGPHHYFTNPLTLRAEGGLHNCSDPLQIRRSHSGKLWFQSHYESCLRINVLLCWCNPSVSDCSEVNGVVIRKLFFSCTASPSQPWNTQHPTVDCKAPWDTECHYMSEPSPHMWCLGAPGLFREWCRSCFKGSVLLWGKPAENHALRARCWSSPHVLPCMCVCVCVCVLSWELERCCWTREAEKKPGGGYDLQAVSRR